MFFVAFVHVRSHPFTVFLWSICGPFANRYIERSLRAREGLCPPLGRNSAVGAAAPLDGSTALIQAIVQVESAGMAAV